MIKVLMERAIPPGFDTSNDAQVAQHARYAVDGFAALAGKASWIQTYITQDKLFGVAVFETEADIAAYRERVGTSGQNVTIHRITRVIDAASAAPTAR
jgi:hypothetical protein